MAEHDPTAAEVAAAIATLQAFEAAQHPVAAPVEPVKSSEEATETAAETEHVTEQAAASHVPVVSEPVSPAAPVAIDPYLARSVKSSPNGF